MQVLDQLTDKQLAVLAKNLKQIFFQQETEVLKESKRLHKKTKITLKHARYAIKTEDKEYVTNFCFETEYLGHSLVITPQLSLDVDNALLFSKRSEAETYINRLNPGYKKYCVTKVN